MDAIALHRVWGSMDCKVRGEDLSDCILTNHLEVKNVTDPQWRSKPYTRASGYHSK